MDLLRRLISGGGAPATVNFIPLYQRYAIEEQASGRQPMPVEDWLQIQGYTMDKNGHINPIKETHKVRFQSALDNPQMLSLQQLANISA